MADKKRLVLVGAHTGQVVNALAPVARLFSTRSHDVRVFLQDGQSAAESYKSGSTVASALKGMNVEIVNQVLGDADVLVCSLSPVAGYNMETDAVYTVNGCVGRKFGIQDFPNSWRNPGWRDYSRMFDTLFSPMPEPNFSGKCVVTGWGALEKWRGVDVQKMGSEGRRILGINTEPVLYVFLSPEKESPLALEHLALLMKEKGFHNVVVIVNRHGRELSNPVPGNDVRYRRALCFLSDQVRAVFDNSLEYKDLERTDLRSIHPWFRPQLFLDHQQMLALTSFSGLALSFFGTDALVAPYLASQGVLSALWLDPVYGGAVLKREKQVEKLDLPSIFQQLTDDRNLMAALEIALNVSNLRNGWSHSLASSFPFPEKPASQIIVDEILRQLG